MKIITLTLSPAFDVHVEIDRFTVGREHLAASHTRGIGGKGINISRALLENGVKNTALVLLGDENGGDFARGMDACGIDYQSITVPGRIRENMTIHSEVETRVSFKGFTAPPSVLGEILAMCAPDADTIVTFTGSLPAGIGLSDAAAFLEALRDSGARVVIDSKSIPLDVMQSMRPWLIKPNAEELESYLGALDTDGILAAAKRLHESGIENAMISLGADGALLVCLEGAFIARPPKIDAVSTIGAGDSMIAGFIGAAGCSAVERLRIAAAWGTAACLTEGTNPPLPADIEKIAAKVEVKRL